VGAHGIQLTGQRAESRQAQYALAHNLWKGADAESVDEFAYDVYSVDFAEQGGALHGAFLTLQSDFVASVVQQLEVGFPLWNVVFYSSRGFFRQKGL
jgi:hypothetical protein